MKWAQRPGLGKITRNETFDINSRPKKIENPGRKMRSEGFFLLAARVATLTCDAIIHRIRYGYLRAFSRVPN